MSLSAHEEREAQRGLVTYQRSPSQKMVELGFKPWPQHMGASFSRVGMARGKDPTLSKWSPHGPQFPCDSSLALEPENDISATGGSISGPLHPVTGPLTLPSLNLCQVQ